MALIPYPTLPNFVSGSPLSAADLNRISACQTWLKSGRGINPVFLRAVYNDDGSATWNPEYRYIRHRHNYIHWNTPASVTSRIWVQRADGATSNWSVSGAAGVVNISSANIPIDSVYKIWWGDNEGDPTPQFTNVFAEVRDSSFAINYPATVNAFSGVSSAQELNDLVANTEYLLDVFNVPIPGLHQMQVGFNQHKYSIYTTYHTCRYLFLRAKIYINGDGENQGEFALRVNGAKVYGDVVTDGEVTYAMCLDLEGGGDHVIYSGEANPITMGTLPSLGQLYTIQIDGDFDVSRPGCWYKTIYLAESAVKRNMA